MQNNDQDTGANDGGNNSNPSVIPERLKASDFTLFNATANNVEKFQMSLDYIQNGDPAGTAILKAMWLEGGRVALNNYELPSAEVMATLPADVRKAYEDHQGTDSWDPRIHALMWNPDSALQVYNSDKQLIGIGSPANALVHEAAHAIDPLSMSHLQDRLPVYQNLGEYLAGRYENMSSENLGEVVRENHGGYDLRVDNPTVHTAKDAFGTVVWVQKNELGVTEYGPAYHFQKIAPIWGDPAVPPDPGHAPNWGSTEPGSNHHDANDPDPYAGRREDNGTGIAGYDQNGNPIYNPPVPNADDIPPSPWDGGGQADDNDGWDDAGDEGGGGDYGGGAGGCVAVESYLPDGGCAGDIVVDSVMQLSDSTTLQEGRGIVSFSCRKQAEGFRIETSSGASLICSDTAPIPTRDKGLLTPFHLLGEHVAVRWDEAGTQFATWERVVKVEPVGLIYVQHITVGDKCFWAGEKKGAYILHHNMKDAGGGGGGGYDDWPDWFDPFKVGPKPDQSMTVHHGHQGGDAATLVGMAPPHVMDA